MRSKEYREEDEEEEEEFEEEFEEREEEEEEEISIKAETPQNTPPSIVLTVTYDGKVGKALVKLYDPVNDRVYFWYDNTGHKPYLLTNARPEEIITKFTKVILHPGFSHMEAVEKYDPLSDRVVVLTKINAKDPLSIGGKADSIREVLPKTWESRIRYHLCYIYDNEIIPGMFYRVEDGKLVQVPIEVPTEIEGFINKLYANNKEFLEEARRWIPLFQAPVPNIKRLSLDIEVFTPQENRVPNPKEANYEIIAIGLAGSDG